MQFDQALLGIVALCLGVVFYHHVAYPVLLKFLAARVARPRPAEPAMTAHGFPAVDILVPAYNEAAVIAAKVRNLAELRYPKDKLRIILAFDGCTDDSPQVARRTLASLADADHFSVVEHQLNRGKIAMLNGEIAKCGGDLIALTDASSIVATDILHRAVTHFADPGIGAVCATYRLENAGSEGEFVYWQYQTRIKRLEAALAAPIGAHGAFYMLRRKLWEPLPADTINDDFFIPMRIAMAGHKVVYDPGMVATELEKVTAAMEFRRRVRIGAGNMQQLLRMPQLLNPARGYLAFLFISGKGLRALIPLFLFCGALSLLLLMLRSEHPFAYTAGACALVGGAGILTARARARGSPALLVWLGYFLEGHFASGVGGLLYLTRRRASSGNSWAGLGSSRPRQ
jgi:cellulose synthase/poly-beta-1,6-N-acetylglucosamine synthase-like glycosyltransferase